MAETGDDGAAGLLLTDFPAPGGPEPGKDTPAGKSPAKPRKSKDARTLRPAAVKPVARIAVDLPLAHLDRPFDYLVPERLADQAQPGVRGRVRFAGQLTDGFLIERAEASGHQGSLRYLERVVSAEQVLTTEIAGLARAVADRYGGILADVLRLAVPQRHAATEAAARGHSAGDGRAPVPPRPAAGPWARYPAGPSFLD
ncbi:MAG TPA: primosome assembly protein PriA, partial [Trebonia sp.]